MCIRDSNKADLFMIIRGTEGSSQCPLDRRVPMITQLSHASLNEAFSRPGDYNIQESDRILPDKNITLEQTLAYGLEGLQNPTSEAFYQLAYNALTILKGFNLIDDTHLLIKTLKANVSNHRVLSFWHNV